MNLDSIIGHELPKQCLYAMLKKPSEAPRVVVVSGPYGTGRRSLVKNYIKSMYCPNIEKTGSNCGTCETCRDILNDIRVYREYDYSMIPNIEYSNYIVITNFEKCPRELQVELYNKFEELNVVFIITENTDNIIDNIMTLSLILRTSLIKEDDIVNYLLDKSQRLNLDISGDSIRTIARRSRGHLSDAIKMLSKYSMLDEETFSKMILSAREMYILFLIASYANKRDKVDLYINELKKIPLAYLKIDYEALILEIIKTATKFEKPKDKYMEILIEKIKTKVLDLYYILNDKIIYNSFTNDDAFQSAMYVIYLKLNNRIR